MAAASDDKVHPSLGEDKRLEKAGKQILQQKMDDRCADLHAIHTDEKTGASAYVGNISVARDKSRLKTLGIYRIVNCQSKRSSNYHDNDPDFTYLRFPLADHFRVNGTGSTARLSTSKNGVASDVDVLAFCSPVFEFVDEALAQGVSVLIHCIAGAHRAGTTGVAYMMHRQRVQSIEPETAADAISRAQKIRTFIDPAYSHRFVLILESLARSFWKNGPPQKLNNKSGEHTKFASDEDKSFDE